jgi:DNA-binding transcriptional LysR family regulator
MIKPDHLLVFAKVAEFKNITRAAEYLCRSQPAISGQLNSLQQQFSLPLYQRQGGGVVLTELGQSLLPYAQRMAKTIRDVESFRLQQEEGGQVHLTLGATTTIANFAIPEMWAKFKRQYPHVKIEWIVGNTDKILDQLPHLDAALVEGRVKGILNSGFYPSIWRQDEIVVLMPVQHILAKQKEEITLQQVLSYSLVWREKGSGTREMIEYVLKSANIELAPEWEFHGTEAIKEAVRVGLGLGLVSKMAVQSLPKSLCWRTLAEKDSIHRPLSLVLPENSVKLEWIQKIMN